MYPIYTPMYAHIYAYIFGRRGRPPPSTHTHIASATRPDGFVGYAPVPGHPSPTETVESGYVPPTTPHNAAPPPATGSAIHFHFISLFSNFERRHSQS